ncbi:MAG: YqgE/AlgH family protein [Candidatus Acidiferrales bacterium]
MHIRSTAAFAFCLLLVLSNTPVHAAQDKPDKGDSEDKALFLVARPDLADPFFKESVVLMFPSSMGAEEGVVVGLIVNRPARIALSEIFPNDKALKDRSETVYFGGPVDVRIPGVVFRSSKAAKQAVLLFGDVYVSFDPDFIKELLENPERTPDLRLFLGRSQWAPAQLQNEMLTRAWYSVQAETNLIFSARPQSLWRNLLKRAEPAPFAKAAEVPFGLSANIAELPTIEDGSLRFYSRSSARIAARNASCELRQCRIKVLEKWTRAREALS